MNYLYELLRCCDARINNVCNQRFKMIGECDNEMFNFIVKEIIETFSLVHDVIIESSESCNQVLKVLHCPHRVAGRDCCDDGRFTWWNGIIDSLSFLPELHVSMMRIHHCFLENNSRCFGFTFDDKRRSRLCLCLF